MSEWREDFDHIPLEDGPPPGEGAGKKRRPRREAPFRPNGEAHAGWYDQLILGREGPRDCVANVAIVLRSDPAFVGRLSYNLMRARTVVGSMPWHVTDKPRDWSDRDSIALAEWVQLHGLIAKPTTCDQAVRTVAAERTIHPLRDRLDGLAWDGSRTSRHWLTDYLGVEKTPYSIAVGRAWLISGVARAYEPGCKADHALILEGDQGKLKSTLAEIIALERGWFTDEIADLGSKDSAQDLPGKWIIEISELAAMRKARVERIKAFLSRAVDHYRPSYGSTPRTSRAAASSSARPMPTEYLTDTTGNRRFWPVKVGTIDLATLRLDVEQLWAEAVAAYRNGEHWWLDTDDEALAADEQEKRRPGDPWEDLVVTAAGSIYSGALVKYRDRKGYITEVKAPGNGVVTTNAVLELLNVPEERRDKSEATRVGAILVAAGWIRNDGRRSVPRYWYTPPEVRTDG